MRDVGDAVAGDLDPDRHDELVEVAGTLGRHDTTVDLDTARYPYPPPDFDDCNRSITSHRDEYWATQSQSV